MIESLYLTLLLLISTTANKDHYISHGGPIQGRSYVDHYLKAHHIGRTTGSSHGDAEFAVAKDGGKHGDLATGHTGGRFSLLERQNLRMCLQANIKPCARQQ